MIVFTRKMRRGTEVRKRTVLWGNSNCHQLDSNWKKNIFFNCRYIAGNCCSRKRVGGLWSAIAINDQQLKEKIYILMDTDGGPQADDGGEQGLIIRTSFILSEAHQATQVFDDWWLMDDYWWLMTDGWWLMIYGWWLMIDDWWLMVDLTKTKINPLKRMEAEPCCYASASVL